MGYSHLIEYYSAIERNERLIHVTTKVKTLYYQEYNNARVRNMIPLM